jgi:hypothetical protein
MLGEGLLSAEPALWPIYRDALAQAGHDPRGGRMAGALQAWVSADPERDWPVVGKHLSHQLDTYRRYMVEGTDQPLPRPVDPDRLRSRQPKGPLSYFAYGTPEEIASWIRAYTSHTPVETVFFWASISGMPQAMVSEHVRMICTRLGPLLADYDPQSAV